MKQVTFIPNQEVGSLIANVLLEANNKVVLLCQDRIIVAAEDNGIYRPYPESKPIDLFSLL